MIDIAKIFQEQGWEIHLSDSDFIGTKEDITVNKTNYKISTWFNNNKLRMSVDLTQVVDDILPDLIRFMACLYHGDPEWTHEEWDSFANKHNWEYKKINSQWINVKNGIGKIIMKDDTTKITINGLRIIIIKGSIEGEDLELLYELTETLIHERFK
jgi:hypothetical protein